MDRKMMELRFKRAATINSMVLFNLIDKDHAKLALKGNLIEGDDRTFVNDSYLLGKTWDELVQIIYGGTK